MNATLACLMRAVLVATVLCSAQVASAHRFHAGMTEISFNERSGALEIVHTLMAHDVDAMLARRHQRQLDLATPEDEALLREYVEQRFFVLDAQGKALAPRWLGTSVNVDKVVIYREIEATPLARAVRVRDLLLTDELPDQKNTVNVHRNGKTHTFRFNQHKSEQAID